MLWVNTLIAAGGCQSNFIFLSFNLFYSSFSFRRQKIKKKEKHLEGVKQKNLNESVEDVLLTVHNENK